MPNCGLGYLIHHIWPDPDLLFEAGVLSMPKYPSLRSALNTSSHLFLLQIGVLRTLFLWWPTTRLACGTPHRSRYDCGHIFSRKYHCLGHSKQTPSSGQPLLTPLKRAPKSMSGFLKPNLELIIFNVIYLDCIAEES